MTFGVVNWSTLSEVTSAKLQQMMDNDQYLKDQFNVVLAQTSSNSVFAITDYSGAYDTILNLTVSTQAAVYYRISAQHSGISTTNVGAGVFLVGILRDGGLIAEQGGYCLGNTGFQNGGSLFALESPSAGTHTYSLAVKRLSGNAGGQVEASRMYFMIEQMSQP